MGRKRDDFGRDKNADSSTSPSTNLAPTGGSGDEPSTGCQETPLEVRVLRLRHRYEPAFAEHDRARTEVQENAPEIVALIESRLGPHGRLISASKTSYCRRYPSRLVVFNANLLVDRRKLWWGDLDLSDDAPRLKRLAGELGSELHVLYERDGRFHGRDGSPLVENYVYWTDGRRQQLGEDTAAGFEIRRGRPRRRRRTES